MDHHGGVEQLHFDVPLISTRRSASANARKSSRRLLLGSPDQDDDYMDTSRSVPFSWEAAPGVPKLSSTTRTTGSSKEDKCRRCNNADDAEDKCSNGRSDDNDDDLVVVLDRVSLSESPDRLGPGGRASRAPSFIMNRFLRAANALAAASLDEYSLRITPPPGSREHQLAKLRRRQRGGGAAPASSGCGLVELFPRSLKSVACRFRSPVRCQTPRIGTMEVLIAQRSRRIRASDGLSSEDGLSSKACRSPGWGLPLPDTGRLRIRGAGVDLGKGRRLVDGKESRDGRRRRRRSPRIATSGAGGPLPMLKTPTEPWLARAVNSANRGS